MQPADHAKQQLSSTSRSAAVSAFVTAAAPPGTRQSDADEDCAIAAAHTASGQNGMVVTVSSPATQVGLKILQQGGNAVDAAVAVAFALAVTYPEAGNIGGGGFMLVHPGRGREPVCIDYREIAPAAATPGMFANDAGGSALSHRYVGIPGTVRGLALAHAKFGRLRWAELVEPAIQLACRGFQIDAHVAAGLNQELTARTSNGEFVRLYGHRDHRPWQAEDRLTQVELGKTLIHLRDSGPDAFYLGPIATLIVEEMQRGGGLIDSRDLQHYAARQRAPIHGTFRSFDVFGPPPASSGGTALVEMLNILETFPLAALGRWSPEANHLMIEAMRRAYLDRARWLGDADYVRVPPSLIEKSYAQLLASQIDLSRATGSLQLAADLPLSLENQHTTHFSVIDHEGMAVANTYTLEDRFGSRIVVRGAGFLLNNQMGDFNRVPGRTDASGRIGTPANQIAPGKRMLSSQSPTIVARNGDVVLVTGSPGGRTIINTVLCVVLNVLEFGMSLKSAIEAPRFHHAWLPDWIDFEPLEKPAYAGLVAGLRQRGHRFAEKPSVQGDAHSILVQDHVYHGVADGRLAGSAQGF